MADKLNLTAKGFAEFRAVNEDMDMKQTTRIMAALSSYEDGRRTARFVALSMGLLSASYSCCNPFLMIRGATRADNGPQTFR